METQKLLVIYGYILAFMSVMDHNDIQKYKEKCLEIVRCIDRCPEVFYD
jgi:hypothetical protein